VPDQDYFIQIGGTASGEVITKEQADTHGLTGCGTVEVYGMDAKPYDVLLRWFEFYANESCGKCTPCREGTFYLYHLLKDQDPEAPIPWEKIRPVIESMKVTSFCDLGKSLPIPVESYIKNILGFTI
jgi:NADH-quinone oxidoreductase subunit F